MFAILSATLFDIPFGILFAITIRILFINIGPVID